MYASNADQQRRERVKALAEQLYRKRHPYLLGIATRNAANRADAEEAVQQAFLAFLGKFDPDSDAPPLAWVTLTLKRECWAKRAREHLDRRVGQGAAADPDGSGFCIADLPSEAASVRETVEQAESIVDARQRLASLKPAERRALVLIAAGYSYKEIAKLNQWTLTKVNRCAAEGREALRKGQLSGNKQTRAAPSVVGT